GGDGLAPTVVGHTDDGDLGDGRVFGQDGFDLDGVDVLATRDDHVLHAIGDEEIAVGVDVSGVAGAQETVGREQGRVLGVATPVTRRVVPRPADDLAGLPAGKRFARGDVADLDLDDGQR